MRNNGKTISAEQLPPEAWQVVFGNAGETAPLQDAYSRVSWVYRSIDIKANNLRQVPFTIENLSGDEVDNSKDYQNAVGFLPHPRSLFALLEMAQTVFGMAYLYKQSNILGNKTFGVRYMLPTSIKPEWKKNESGQVVGLAGFKRIGANDLLPVESVVYFWRADPFVEMGTPQSSPMQAALASAGVLLNIDKFASTYFERGAVKATLLAVSGNPNDTEKERIKSVWARVMKGIANAFGEMVINAAGLTPIVVGEGLEALSDKNLTQEKREAIASALGIPHSILFSGAANYSVSQQDEVNLYKQTIIPDCEFLEEVLNEQLFVPAGYRLNFHPESMDIFQEDETARAAAMSQFMDALTKAGSLDMAQAMFDIFGYEISDAAMAFIKAHYKSKEERAAEMEAKLPPANSNPTVPAAPADNAVEEPPQKRTDLDKWRIVAQKAFKAGKPQRSFESDEIPMVLQGAIAGALESAKSLSEIDHIFDNPWMGYP